MYSSGTTGRPKGVMLSHANMVAHTVNAHDGWEFEPGDKNMVSMPLFHVGGSSYVLFGIHDGVHSYMTRDPDGTSLAGAILNGANRTFLVPAVLAQVLQAGPDAVRLFGALKTYTYGAAPMPPPLLRAAMEAWPDTDFIQVYGLTEVSGVATHLMADEHRTAVADGHPERLVSAGRPIPGVELKIVDPATLEDLPVGEHGEIWMKTPQLFKGYLGKPEETAEVITEDGWFRTGDMGKVDADGFVFVEDRLKDMIISGGENIYSPEVERVLAEHPSVMEVAIIGIPDDTWGESVKAVVAAEAGHDGDRGGADRVLSGVAGEVQVPEVGRHHRGAAAEPDRQDPQARAPEAVLGRSRPGGELTRLLAHVEPEQAVRRHRAEQVPHAVALVERVREAAERVRSWRCSTPRRRRPGPRPRRPASAGRG